MPAQHYFLFYGVVSYQSCFLSVMLFSMDSSLSPSPVVSAFVMNSTIFIQCLWSPCCLPVPSLPTVWLLFLLTVAALSAWFSQQGFLRPFRVFQINYYYFIVIIIISLPVSLVYLYSLLSFSLYKSYSFLFFYTILVKSPMWLKDSWNISQFEMIAFDRKWHIGF